MPKILISEIDKSVNIVFPDKAEARFVQRKDEYAIIYLSIQTGCDKACRFCHLTQLKEVETVDQTLEDLLKQTKAVMDVLLAKTDERLQKINVNFMSRGEVSAHEGLMKEPLKYLVPVQNLILNEIKTRGGYSLETIHFNLSTIGLPGLLESKLIEAQTALEKVTEVKSRIGIYYSLYSMEPYFRKRWLPKAAPPAEVLEYLKQFKERTQGEVVFHWALIDGENDSESNLDAIKTALQPFKGVSKFNLVRYNPFSENQGKESPDEVRARWLSELKEFLGHPDTREIPRVGKDVAASCGMFIKDTL